MATRESIGFSQYPFGDFHQHRERFPPRLKNNSSPNSQNIRDTGTGEAYVKANFTKNPDNSRSNIPPVVPYYGLERAVEVLESLDLADSTFVGLSLSDTSETLKLLLKISAEASIKIASVNEDPTFDFFEPRLSSLIEKHYKHIEDKYEDRIQEISLLRYAGLSDLFIPNQIPLLRPDNQRLQDFDQLYYQVWQDIYQLYYQVQQDIDIVKQGLDQIQQDLKIMKWQAFRRYSVTREKSIKKVLQDVISEVPHRSPSSELEPWDIPINYSNLWSRKKIATWKESFGRSKDWRSCRFVKTNKKYLSGNLFIRRDWPTKMNWKHAPPVVPINMLRRETSYRLRFRTRPPKVTTPAYPFLVQEWPWDNCGIDTDESRFEHSSRTSEPASSNAVNPVLTQSPDTQATFPELVLPYENFVGAVLGASFRILKFLRSENHGDIYAVQDLSPTATRYEAKAYILRGVPQRTRDYRVRNMKKLTSKPSFICSFDQQGRKFVINRLAEEWGKVVTISSREAGKGASKLGAVGRRNTPEFDDAFPKLSTISNIRIAETSIYVKTDGLLATLEPYMWKQEAQSFAPMRPSELMTVLQNGLPNDKDTHETGISVLGGIDQEKGEGTRKLKTPQQIERSRVRQRLSRIRKRAQRKSGLPMEEGCSSEKVVATE